MNKTAGAAFALLLLAACGEPVSTDQPPAPPAPAEAPPPPVDSGASPAQTALTDGWVGRWAGPEGVFLDIQPRDPATDLYPVTLKDSLDGQADYKARIDGQALSFERRGQTVTVRHGLGVQTGFKDLLHKTDCLILVEGKEGYCRG